ncbi:MAG: Oxygen-independent coproporphyrinogen-III oxidase-like protein [Candidatus Dichloromethanomonas elyunquensis]|nr:MAG: Oxygen-independent coproporphyrinogen-III oxidase-like protein [Candidatus Dichloromethanomonas elyunquensis]
MPSLYVHVPFCIKKCDYCAFYSLPLIDWSEGYGRMPQSAGDSGLISGYLRGAAREIELRSGEAPAGVSSLYIGGGTPTVLSWRQLDTLLNEIHQYFTFSDSEKTTEANPGTVDEEKLKVLRNYRVNRISLGAQSFNDRLLCQMGRIHRSQDIWQAVKRIRKAGIHNLNLDLIFGLPGQDLKDWKDTLRKASELSPEHLSVYALTLEEGTPFGEKYLQDRTEFLPDDDLQADMYAWAAAFLEEKGYRHYEISNFARPGYECKHNLTYWQGEDYIGLGPGAVSCIQNVRSKNNEDITAYIEDHGKGQKTFALCETEFLTAAQLMSEYMMLGLRTEEGISLTGFLQKFKVSVQDIYGPIMANYIDRGFLFIAEDRLTLNKQYMFVANAIIRDFMR